MSKFNFNQTQGDILIVDDIPENLQLLFTMLSENGYDVRRVLSGKQALKAAQVDPPDLILLDIKMPRMDGYEVCRKLKSNPKTEQIPVIFLSALNDPFDKVQAFDVGASDYITKPFQLPEVLMRVKNQLELLKVQRELKAKNKELEALNRELESFSYSVAHDLKNPLTNILGFTELLQCKYKAKLDDKIIHFLDIIHDSGVLMQNLIEDLLRLSQVKYLEMKVEDVNLSEVVAQYFESLEKYQGQRLVALNIHPQITVRGDLNLLKIALENLCSNAWKFTKYKDITQIEFGQINPIQSPEIYQQVLLEKSANLPIYFLKDNGIGFAMAEAEKLFIPFNRLHNPQDFEGTGIGLSIVQRIVERHQGQIWYDSKVNEGTTFYFTLNC